MIIDRGHIIYDGATAQIKERFGRRRRLVISFKRDYLPEDADKPLPPAEAPIAFAGLDPVRLERRGSDGEEHEQPAVDIDVPAVLAEHGGPAAAQAGDGSESADAALAAGVNSLDEPGARQFMAELAGLMDNGGHLRVRRLNLRQYQVSFDRKRYTGGEVIGRLMERYEVDDLQLHEPELSDIVRAIYEGRHQI